MPRAKQQDSPPDVQEVDPAARAQSNGSARERPAGRPVGRAAGRAVVGASGRADGEPGRVQRAPAAQETPLPAKRFARKPTGGTAASAATGSAAKHARTKQGAKGSDAKDVKVQDVKVQDVKAKGSRGKVGGMPKGQDVAGPGSGDGSAAAGAGNGSVAGSTATSKTKPVRAARPAGRDAAQAADSGRDLFFEHQRELLLAERGNYTRQAEELIRPGRGARTGARTWRRAVRRGRWRGRHGQRGP